ESVAMALRSTPARVTSELFQTLVDQSSAVDQLGLETLQLPPAPAHELQLSGDVHEGLLEDAAPRHRVLGLVPFPPQLSARGLRLQQLLQLVKRQAEEITQPHDLVHSVDVGCRVAAVLSL